MTTDPARATREPMITSLANSKIKNVVKLRQRSHRDDLGLMIIEGYRELKRALDNDHRPAELFFCEDMFHGGHEQELVDRCRDADANIFPCTSPVFTKMSYRDRPEGLLAVAPQVRGSLEDLSAPESGLFVVAEAVEKPGNLGTILRSADAAGVDAVLVCDRCTDLNNPNVVRASIGALFSLPVVEASTADTLAWLRNRGVQILATSPHADALYTEVDMVRGTAVVIGAEQYGLSETWLKEADVQVRIPMMGQADSLNVASACTILLYEALRQRTAPSPGNG